MSELRKSTKPQTDEKKQ